MELGRKKRKKMRPRNEVWNDADTIISMYQDGMVSTDIAKELNVCGGTILRILHEHNIPVYHRSKIVERTIKNEQEIISDYKNGKTYREIVEKYYVSNDSIKAILKKNGVPVRSSTEKAGGGKTEVWNYAEEILELYKEGITARELAEKYSVHPNTISRIINDITDGEPIQRKEVKRKTSRKETIPRGGLIKYKDEILQDRESGMTYKDLAHKYNVSTVTISKFIKKNTTIPDELCTSREVWKEQEDGTWKRLELWTKEEDGKTLRRVE